MRVWLVVQDDVPKRLAHSPIEAKVPFPDKAVHGRIIADLLDKDVKRRLEYFQEEEVVTALLEGLLLQVGP